MLQRAANNAYSWWWASHVRTKQSKWLEQSLQDMEEKVQGMLKLIEEDGDSFAKRAEMYYKRRPELIHTVEESYRAFRALADRYDHLSKELQNANRAIGTVFPDQVQFSMDDDDDYSTPKVFKNSQIPPRNSSNTAPNVPKAPVKDIKRFISTASKKFQIKKPSYRSKSSGRVSCKGGVSSGFTNEQAAEQIDKLQKDILACQTVKEFVKSSYETGLARYWEIENQIMEMQQKVCSLQDEFNVDAVIDDDEARALMAGTAIKSCQEKLDELSEKHEKSARDAREECKKIESASRRLKSLKDDQSQHGRVGEDEDEDESRCTTEEMCDTILGEEKARESLDLSSLSSITVTELAEKIDKLVGKVIGLESAVSSQAILIDTLKTESSELQEQIRRLEDEKEDYSSGSVKELEAKLRNVHDLNRNVEKQNTNLETTFAEAHLNLEQLSEKLSSVRPDSLQEEEPEISFNASKVVEKFDSKEENVNTYHTEKHVAPQAVTSELSGAFSDKKPEEKARMDRPEDDDETAEIGLNWQQMFLSGMEDREKTLLKEYTEILTNFKDVKRKLSDVEKREKDSQFDAIVQMREAKKAILSRDEEIQRLRQKINSLQGNASEPGSEPCRVEEEEDRIKLVFVERTPSVSISAVEQKLRVEIDRILDENLDFWLRFCTAFHQIQKFKTQVHDLKDEISKVEEKKKQGGSVTTRIKSEVLPIYKHLREIHTELTLWLEQSLPLKDELKRRFASLCSIQEEITKALKEGAEEEQITFSSHQAAKFQGEILNMKQENNKVREELETGLDHVSILQMEVEKTLRKLNEDYGISSDQTNLKHSMSKSRIPLRSFIFGVRQKRQKHSLFSYMHPTRRYHILRDGLPVTHHSS